MTFAHIIQRLKTNGASSSPHPTSPRRKGRSLDWSKYSTRLIALKIAYFGGRYKGFAHNADRHATALPTVERELWRALRKVHLIPPGNHVDDTEDNGDETEEEIDWEGCQYSKCGRTDKGVSAFGQVIGIRVRSNRPLTPKGSEPVTARNGEGIEREGMIDDEQRQISEDQVVTSTDPDLPNLVDGEDDDGGALSWDHVKDELPYLQILNRVLPDDIRVLAWCSSPPEGFSARFSCRERRYRYFFTQPAFMPVPRVGCTRIRIEGQAQTDTEPLNNHAAVSNGVQHGRRIPEKDTRRRKPEGWLDIEAMREAARLFIGVHDFRNFCKVDPTKQITNFERRIFHADIIELDPNKGLFGYNLASPPVPIDPSAAYDSTKDVDPSRPPRVWAFVVHGSAFLWHQVRHMVAILFLIGQGFESPSLVSELLNVTKHPCKPMYTMADETPLVLWDCFFPRQDDPDRRDALQWLYQGDEKVGRAQGQVSLSAGNGSLHDRLLWGTLWTRWRSRKMHEILAGSLLEKMAGSDRYLPRPEQEIGAYDKAEKPGKSATIFDGGDSPRHISKYIPLLDQRRRAPVEEINSRFVARKDHRLGRGNGIEDADANGD